MLNLAMYYFLKNRCHQWNRILTMRTFDISLKTFNTHQTTGECWTKFWHSSHQILSAWLLVLKAIRPCVVKESGLRQTILQCNVVIRKSFLFCYLALPLFCILGFSVSCHMVQLEAKSIYKQWLRASHNFLSCDICDGVILFWNAHPLLVEYVLNVLIRNIQGTRCLLVLVVCCLCWCQSVTNLGACPGGQNARTLSNYQRKRSYLEVWLTICGKIVLADRHFVFLTHHTIPWYQ